MVNNPDHYFTIGHSSVAEFSDRGSKFLAFAYPVNSVEEFKQVLLRLKKEHPKAVHHCFAWRMGPGTDQFRANDDGEPSGTAGKPILGQIDSKGLTNIAVIVVRYFGGTLLGVPGLINAYKTASCMALQLAPIIKKTVDEVYELQFDYNLLNDVMRILKQFDCSIREREILLFCRIIVAIPVKISSQVLLKFKDFPQLDAKKLV